MKHLVKSADLKRSSLASIINSIKATSEFKLLKTATENNISHNGESVYSHTLDVVNKLRNDMGLSFINKEETKKLANLYFNSRIDRFNRSELLLVAAYLHDIGKPQTLLKDKEGKTTAFGHEIKGSAIAKKVLDRLKFKRKEQRYILELVALHSGYSLRFMDFLMSLAKDKLAQGLSSVKYIPEIVLFMIADNENAPTFPPYKKFILETVLQLDQIYQSANNRRSKNQISLDKLAEDVREYIRTYSKPWPIDSRVFHLNEEVGEFNDIYMQVVGMKDRKQDTHDIQIALTDILFEVITLYDSFGIDMHKAISEELQHEENR